VSAPVINAIGAPSRVRHRLGRMSRFD